ncbi:MAG: hypothetical protein HY619_04365 [Thaumarchaeota archaeon]|nr:hypothetical protein [Nitrososphaerota archaeon]
MAAQTRVRRSRLTEYERLNGKYLKEAEVLLKKKDYSQASEKLWGAAAENVKALAASKNLELGTHASLWSFVEKTHNDHPELNLMHEFSYAGNLHTNFYEDWLSPGYVEEGLQIVRNFVEKMRKLM